MGRWTKASYITEKLAEACNIRAIQNCWRDSSVWLGVILDGRQFTLDNRVGQLKVADLHRAITRCPTFSLLKGLSQNTNDHGIYIEEYFTEDGTKKVAI